jgi:hypothetical protein
MIVLVFHSFSSFLLRNVPPSALIFKMGTPQVGQTSPYLINKGKQAKFPTSGEKTFIEVSGAGLLISPLPLLRSFLPFVAHEEKSPRLRERFSQPKAASSWTHGLFLW